MLPWRYPGGWSVVCPLVNFERTRWWWRQKKRSLFCLDPWWRRVGETRNCSILLSLNYVEESTIDVVLTIMSLTWQRGCRQPFLVAWWKLCRHVARCSLRTNEETNEQLAAWKWKVRRTRWREEKGVEDSYVKAASDSSSSAYEPAVSSFKDSSPHHLHFPFSTLLSPPPLSPLFEHALLLALFDKSVRKRHGQRRPIVWGVLRLGRLASVCWAGWLVSLKKKCILTEKGLLPLNPFPRPTPSCLQERTASIRRATANALRPSYPQQCKHLEDSSRKTKIILRPSYQIWRHCKSPFRRNCSYSLTGNRENVYQRCIYPRNTCTTCAAPLDLSQQDLGIIEPEIYCTRSTAAGHRPLMCIDSCGLKFHSTDELKKHSGGCRHDAYQCAVPTCQKAVRYKTMFSHLRKDHPDLKWNCAQCGNQLWDLESHAYRENHSSYKCHYPECGSMASGIGELRRHQLIHQKKAPRYPCPHCRT